MSHRVLLNFQCEAKHLEDNKDGLPRLVGHAASVLARGGWETAHGTQAFEIFQKMAEELPYTDLPSFVRNTRLQMFRKSPYSELTIGYFVDQNVGTVRVRIRADRNATLADLGKTTAGILLTVQELSLTSMHLYENRNGDHLAEGQEKVDKPYNMYARESLPVTVPFLFAVFLIIFGGSISVLAFNSGWQFTVLGTSVWDWYGRIFAPLLMVIVTSLAIIIPSRKRARLRTAEWII